MPDESLSLQKKRQQLLDLLQSLQSCAVAMSAGVDSAVVAKAAQLALGQRAIAITAHSASLADGELQQAREIAELIGIRHLVISTDELSNLNYTQNEPDRCYHCKNTLYTQMSQTAKQQGIAVLVNGANLDDVGDYRPGMQAATEFSVRSPLLECEIDKQQVRQLAQAWQLPIWDKPATPCLSSRIAYGQQVTPQRLQSIDKAEQYLKSLLDLRLVRVRYHQGDMARIELPQTAIAKIMQNNQSLAIVQKLKELGFKYVTIDLEGFRSGSQNLVLPLEVLNQADKVL